MTVGGMAGPSYAGDTASVLLTIEGRDGASGQVIDIEVAIPVGEIDRFVQLLQSRKEGWS